MLAAALTHLLGEDCHRVRAPATHVRATRAGRGTTKRPRAAAIRPSGRALLRDMARHIPPSHGKSQQMHRARMPLLKPSGFVEREAKGSRPATPQSGNRRVN